MRRFTILHPSGRIAGLVIKRLLSEDRFADVQLTLLAEMPEKLAELQGNGRVTDHRFRQQPGLRGRIDRNQGRGPGLFG